MVGVEERPDSLMRLRTAPPPAAGCFGYTKPAPKHCTCPLANSRAFAALFRQSNLGYRD